MIPAAVYLRVSTERQDEANQEPDCLRICASRGLAPLIFRERMSGAKRRSEWDRLKEAVRTGAVRTVVFWALDRVGRDRVQVAHDLGELWRWGAAVISVKDSWVDQPAGPLRDLLLELMAWFAQTERAKLIERTKAGMARARLLGRLPGRKKVVPDEVRALAVALAKAHPEWKSSQLRGAIVAAGHPVFHRDTIRSIVEKAGA